MWTYVAESNSEAQAGAQRYMVEYADSALRHYELLGTHLSGIKGYEAYGAQSEVLRKDPSPFKQSFYRSHPWGTPDKTIARVTELANAFGADEIMFIFKYGAMPMATAEKSMRLFAKEVMPVLEGTASRTTGGVSLGGQRTHPASRWRALAARGAMRPPHPAVPGVRNRNSQRVWPASLTIRT